MSLNLISQKNDDFSSTDDDSEDISIFDMDEGFTPETIWINENETDWLPVLLNSTARRKKTIDNYIAHQNLRHTVYRCKEYPSGVYINKYGEICPDDKRSGIYKVIRSSKQEYKDSGEDLFVPDDVDSDDNYQEDDESETDDEDELDPEDWEAVDVLEDIVSSKNKIDEDPEDEDPEDEDHEDEDPEDEDPEDEDPEDEESEDEESEDEDEDHEVDWYMNSDLETELKTNKNKSRERPECSSQQPSKKRKGVKPSKLIIANHLSMSDSDKKDLYLRDLQSATEETEAHYSRCEASKKRHLMFSKLLDATQKLVEEWAKLKKGSGKGIKMTYESKLLLEEPEFEMTFKKSNCPAIIVNFDCKRFNIRCQCVSTFNNISSYLKHMKKDH